MPDCAEHIQKAKHNEDFYASLDLDSTDYRDWIVVGVFYAALHFVAAYLAQQNCHPASHPVTDKYFSRVRVLRQIYRPYRTLKDDRRDASYGMREFTSDEIRSDIFPHLESIKAHLSTLGVPIHS